MSWLTPRRLRNGTIALFVAAFAISSIGLSGSTAAPQHHNTQAEVQSVR